MDCVAEGRYTFYKEQSDEENGSSTHARLAQEAELKASADWLQATASATRNRTLARSAKSLQAIAVILA